MKTIALIILAAFAVSFARVTDDNKGLARVQKVLGKEVYVLSEPLQDYEVVETVTTVNSLLGVQSNIQKQLEETLQAYINKEKKGKIKPFDAAMTTDGDKFTLIKFTE